MAYKYIRKQKERAGQKGSKEKKKGREEQEKEET